METRREAEWWLRAGERDLRAAAGLRDIGLFEGAAFHCQQAAEKFLKGLALSRKAVWQRTHSCVRLLGVLAEAGIPAPPEVATACRRLDHHYIDARYPNGIGGPPDEFYDEAIAAAALGDCRLVEEFVKTHLRE